MNKDKRCKIKENKTNIFINIQLPENKELIFELKPFYKNNNERFNEMAELILKIKEEMDNIKKEVIENLKKETKHFNDKYNII